MKPASFAFHRPATLDDALKLLATPDMEARVIAGGQSLVPAMNLRMAAPQALVDLSALPELAQCRIDSDGSLLVGAMVRHAHFLRQPALASAWPVLSLVLPHVAHEQIRNRGTIGGSLCHADPAAEWPALCMLLDAQIEVQGLSGARTIPAAQFVAGVYETALQEGEILTRVRFPRPAQDMRWGFHEIARRHGDFALAGAMAGAKVDREARLQDLRLAVFAVEDTARRMEQTLAAFVGQTMDEAAIDAMALSIAANIEPRADLHASAELRLDLVHACVHKALHQALAQAPRAANQKVEHE